MRSIFGSTTAALATLSLSSAALGAQECKPDEIVPWWERGVQINAPQKGAERTAIDANLVAAEALVRKTAYGRPRGFAVRPFWGYGDPPTGNQVRAYHHETLVFKACSKFSDLGPGFSVWFNPRPMLWSEGDRPLPDEQGDGLFTERARVQPLFGSTRTFGAFETEGTEGLFVLFTAGGESPTKPVTREEYVRAQIFTLEGKDQAKVKEVLAFASKTQYQRWLDDAPARKKRNADIIAGAGAGSPAAAEKVRASLANADRVAEETFKKQEPAERAELERARANATAAGDKLRAQIAAMTPAERASPAFVIGYDFVAPGTPNATAIVRIDPDFYRARRSSADVRAILVRIQGAERTMKSQHEQMYREFDWAALKALLTR